jgi:hypothetical protein
VATRTQVVVASVAIACVGSAMLCCQQVLSIEGPVVLEGTTSACGLTLPVGACQSCVAAQCCAQASACAGDPACRGLESCLLGCDSDYACRATCVATHVVGLQDDVPTLDTCVAASCESECGLICGTSSSFSPPDAAQSCQDCIAAHACEPTLACATSLECELTGHCAFGCSTPDCTAACLSRAGGADVFTSTAIEVGLPCYSLCGVGHYWQCVGQVAWPVAKSTTQSATLTLWDPNANHGGAPLSGLIVKACDAADPSCSAPVAQATSNESSQATLSLPAIPAPGFGFRGYFDVESPSGLTLPYLYFLSFPLSEADARLTLPIPYAIDVQQSMALVNVTPDPARGHIAVVADDCILINAPGVVVTADGVDGETREYYFSAGQPSATATATDITGVAYFYNVAPGQYSLHVTPRDLGRASSNVRVLVRKGALSLVTALPTAE